MMQKNRERRTILLGTSPLSRSLEELICARHHSDIELIGIVAERGMTLPDESKLPFLGYMDSLNDIIDRTHPARIIVALADQKNRSSSRELVEARFYRNVKVLDGAAVYERYSGKVAIDSQSQSTMLYSAEFQPSPTSLLLSRGLSILVAAIGVLLLAPLFVLISVAIKLDSRGPILFVQERVGLGGKCFRLLKFRTMRPDAQRTSEWEGENRHRITRVGRWLRKYRLDEIPQFFNILKGDMNLVGPRPHPASNYEMLVLVSRNTPDCGDPIPYYSLRSTVRPGITGWAQVRYQYANNLSEEIEKLCFDLYYVKHYSFLLDMQILAETVKVVCGGQEAEQPGKTSSAQIGV